MFMNEEMITSRVVTAEEAQEIVRAFMLKVYGWMSAGLMITAIVALGTYHSKQLLELILENRIVYFGLIIAQLGLVIWLSARIQKMSCIVIIDVLCYRRDVRCDGRVRHSHET
jgi:uncharacterized protein